LHLQQPQIYYDVEVPVIESYPGLLYLFGFSININTMIKHLHNAWLGRLAAVIILCISSVEVSLADWEDRYDNFYEKSRTSFTVGNETYAILTDNTCMLTKVEVEDDETLESYSISSSVTYEDNTYTVTQIGMNVFTPFVNLSHVDIPSSITTIGYYAFENCTNLKEVEIPITVSKIEPYAFSNTGLITVTTTNPDLDIAQHAFYKCQSLESIFIKGKEIIAGSVGDSPFAGCSNLVYAEIDVVTLDEYCFYFQESLRQLILGPTVYRIRDSAFSYSGVQTVHISASTCIIEDFAFSCCYNLTEFIVDPENTSYYSLDGALYAGTQLKYWPAVSVNAIVPEGVESIGICAFSGCKNHLKTVVFPSTLKEIGKKALLDCRQLSDIYYKSLEAPSSCDRSYLGLEYCWYYTHVPTYESSKRYPYLNGYLCIASLTATTESEYGYATFYWDSPVLIPEGIKAYKGTVKDGVLQLEKISNVIPANTAVILRGDPETSYEFYVTEQTGNAVTNNELKGALEATEVSSLDSNYDPYTLSYVEEDGEVKEIAFCRYVGDELAANKAYILLPKSYRGTSDAPTLRVVYNDTTDNVSGIEQVSTSTPSAVDVIYDLRGRRIEKCNAPGLYIKNGRKVLVK
jgi:hypothetical protein